MKKMRIVYTNGKELALDNIEEENVIPITNALMTTGSCCINYLDESYLINFKNVDYVYIGR
jgi:hypothetical protein